MKKLLIAGLTLMSLNVFSQSYIVLQNGVTLTIDKAGFVYDFSHFFLPYRVNAGGGQFIIENEKLATIDENGFLYRKDFEVEEIKEVEKVKAKGLNYFINGDDHLITVDSKGFFYKFDKEEKVFEKAKGFGGNFFTAEADKKKKIMALYTINAAGAYFKMAPEGLNPADITVFGGTYFMTRQNVVHTVGKDGVVYAKPEMKVGAIKKKGGNFFIDDSGKLWTVSDEGFLFLPVLPANIVIAKIVKLGSNYMIDSDGRIFTVDRNGNLNDREMTSHDLREAKVLSF